MEELLNVYCLFFIFDNWIQSLKIELVPNRLGMKGGEMSDRATSKSARMDANLHEYKLFPNASYIDLIQTLSAILLYLFPIGSRIESLRQLDSRKQKNQRSEDTHANNE